MLEDYIKDRCGEAVAGMTVAALAGDHTKTTIHAAKVDLLSELLESLEMYMTQELAIRSASAFI